MAQLPTLESVKSTNYQRLFAELELREEQIIAYKGEFDQHWAGKAIVERQQAWFEFLADEHLQGLFQRRAFLIYTLYGVQEYGYQPKAV